MQVAQDRRYVSFMHSYPNMIPLNERSVERIVQAVSLLLLIASMAVGGIITWHPMPKRL